MTYDEMCSIRVRHLLFGELSRSCEFLELSMTKYRNNHQRKKSKLRKREDSAVTNNNSANINNNNNQPPVEREVRPLQTQQQQPVDPPPFLWRYSNGSSQLGLYNNDQLQTSIVLPAEETGECKGFRKNLRGKWRRLVKKKPPQEVYTIPAEFREQLKQIYVY